MCESLTYSGRNVSVGRVIGIHRRRIMGSQDSVVVDSDSCDGENVEIKKVRQKKNIKQVIQQQIHVQMSIET